MPPRIATYADPEASQALLEQRDRNMLIMDVTSELPWIKPLHVDVGPDGAIAPAALRQFLAAYKRELVRRDIQPKNLFLGNTSGDRDEERHRRLTGVALVEEEEQRRKCNLNNKILNSQHGQIEVTRVSESKIYRC